MVEKHSFSKIDIAQIKSLGLTPPEVNKQLETYQREPSFLKLIRPCRPGDGIRSFTTFERNQLIKLYNDKAAQCRILKFVPASGAASRMFASWFAAAQRGGFGNAGLDRAFWADLKKMPFSPILEEQEAVRLMIKKKDIQAVLDYILTSGLHFGSLPKALVPFHVYRNNDVRTALEEHIGEAANLLNGNHGEFCRLHFTVSADHYKIIKDLLSAIVPKYENYYGVKFRIDLSVQSPATNIVAVDERNLPFRDDEGRLVFRPGGHGALLENFQSLYADLIFVKNIDNIAPDILQKKILPYQKMLGGLALKLRQSIFEMLRCLASNQLNSGDFEVMTDFCRSELQVSFSGGFSRLKPAGKKRQLFLQLNRPLRICGMVKNEGEPGGGPFWVQEKDKSQTLQIVESAHVNHRRALQKEIWSRASYFNPVDMVCCTRNYLGKKFALANYVNKDAYLISLKTEKGRRLKVQEMPGLWNGGMAYWNTVFVELPVAVFNPVKTVYDLLRPQHKGGGPIK